MAIDLAAVEYGAWIARVRNVPVRLLSLDVVAHEEVRCARFPGSKINGALWGSEPPLAPAPTGLARVAEYDPSPAIRSLARQARAHHDRRENSAGYTERPLVLGLPFETLQLERQMNYMFNLVLFGPLAPTWPAWVQAAQEMHLEPGRLSLQHYAVWEPATITSAAPPRDDNAVPQTTLGDLADAISAPVERFGDWRLTAQTPLVLESKGQALNDLPTLEPLVVSALSALGAVADCRPGRENTGRLRVLARQALAANRQLRRGLALYREGKRQRGYQIFGLMGELCFNALPPQLVEVLTLAQFTHIGQHSAFGLGRYLLEPLGE